MGEEVVLVLMLVLMLMLMMVLMLVLVLVLLLVVVVVGNFGQDMLTKTNMTTMVATLIVMAINDRNEKNQPGTNMGAP